MSGFFRWWVIPGTLLLASGVIRLDESMIKATLGDMSAADSAVLPSEGFSNASDQLPEVAMFRDAGGNLQSLAFGNLARDQSLILSLPLDTASELVTVTLWRNVGGGRDVEPWIRLQSIVRWDGTVPIAGVLPGCYDLQVAYRGDPPFAMNQISVPGEVRLATPTPAR